MSLEFEYLQRKNRCEMLIGGDDVCLLSRLFSLLLGADWLKSDHSHGAGSLNDRSQNKGEKIQKYRNWFIN